MMGVNLKVLTPHHVMCAEPKIISGRISGQPVISLKARAICRTGAQVVPMPHTLKCEFHTIKSQISGYRAFPHKLLIIKAQYVVSSVLR